MLSKISSMLDAIADRLEAKGLVKQAYEVNKVANSLKESSLLSDPDRSPSQSPLGTKLSAFQWLTLHKDEILKKNTDLLDEYHNSLSEVRKKQHLLDEAKSDSEDALKKYKTFRDDVLKSVSEVRDMIEKIREKLRAKEEITKSEKIIYDSSVLNDFKSMN